MKAPFFSAKSTIGLAVAVMLTGCATGEGGDLTNEPNFAVGYGDGCQTAIERDKSFSTKTVRDAYLFDSDKAYRGGWRHGFQTCGKKESKAPDGGRILGDENGSSF